MTVTSRNLERWRIVMKIIGIISVIIGAILTLIGISANAQPLDFQTVMRHGPNYSPGNGVIVIGIIILAVGILLLVLRYVKNLKNPPN
jgi:NADH:ubiquinone oxidoreductase subunit 6 (subunit J)